MINVRKSVNFMFSIRSPNNEPPSVAFLDLVVRTPRWTRTVNATEGGSLFGNRIENMKFTDFLTLIKS